MNPQPQGWPPIIHGAVAFIRQYKFALVVFGGLPT